MSKYSTFPSAIIAKNNSDKSGFLTRSNGPIIAIPVSIVVPCYNEEKRLDVALFSSFLQNNPTVRMVLVNDGSRDNTLEVLQGLKKANPLQVEVVNLVVNGGKAEAVRQGLLNAVENGAEFVGYWDADLATPLDAIYDLARIASHFDDVEVVFGSRRPLLGHRIYRPFSRRAISKICNVLARAAIGLPIGDTQCGAKLMRTTNALRQSINTPFKSGWLFDVELFARIAAATNDRCNAFYEYPLCEWTEIPGSNVSMKAVIKSGFQMLGLIARNRLGFLVPQANVQKVATA